MRETNIMAPHSSYELTADQNYAQILIEITEPSKSFEEAKRIIEAHGIGIVETRSLPLGYILMKLDVTDMREIVLSLTESGFSNIKGINSSHLER